MTPNDHLASLLRQRPDEVRALLDQLASRVKSEMPDQYGCENALADALLLWTTGLPEEVQRLGATLALFFLAQLGPELAHPQIRWTSYGPGCEKAEAISRGEFEKSLRAGAESLTAVACTSEDFAFAICMQAGLLAETTKIPGDAVVRIALWLFERIVPQAG